MRAALAVLALAGCGRLWFDEGLQGDAAPGDVNLDDVRLPTGALFTWIGGATVVNAYGTYGTRTIPDVGNMPGARDNGAAWIVGDVLWVFGGHAYGASGNDDVINDLWRHDLTTREWSWMSGDRFPNEMGNYEVMTVPSGTAVPGARNDAGAWSDGSSLYLFGGDGRDGAGVYGALADVWRYDPVAKQWAWMSGPSSVNAVGDYAVNGAPGARSATAVWQTATDAFVYGGTGFGVTPGVRGKLADLWRYTFATSSWLLARGDGTLDVPPEHGTRGVPSLSNSPGGRDGACAWSDSAGNGWLFGGARQDGARFGEMWRFMNSAWTWMHGPTTLDAPPVYGTQGVPDAANTPGGRKGANCWRDANGNFWLFGGTSGSGPHADLWVYSPDASVWTWIGGVQAVGAAGVYGQLDVATPTNRPGARSQGTTWLHPDGSLLLLGADFAVDTDGTLGTLNDLWRIVPE